MDHIRLQMRKGSISSHADERTKKNEEEEEEVLQTMCMFQGVNKLDE